jgi:zinc ribbon protein
MYCQNCGSALSQDARFCQSCGKPQSLPQAPSPPVNPTPIARTIQPQQKPKSKILWLVIGGIVLLVIIIGMLGKSPSDNSSEGKTESSATAASGPTPQEAQFNALTPSEHLTQAKLALKPGTTSDQIADGLRHLAAIPDSAPEAVQARNLIVKLTRAQHLAAAQLLIDSAPVDDLKANLDNLRRANDEIQAVLQQNPHDKDALKLLTLATNKGREALGGSQQTRVAFAQDLQQRLTSMGYDINVWVHGEGADSGHELNLDSEMFKDTATRVQFINSVLPEWKKDLCKVGFRTVKLRQGGTFELGQDYSLGCASR